MTRKNQQAVRNVVGRNVRQLRRLRGWSQERLAEMAGNTNKHISQVERGAVNVTLDVLTAIADGLSVNVATLFRNAPGSRSDARVYMIAERDLDTMDEGLKVSRRVRHAARRRGE